jgi:hypothetical protein
MQPITEQGLKSLYRALEMIAETRDRTIIRGLCQSGQSAIREMQLKESEAARV